MAKVGVTLSLLLTFKFSTTEGILEVVVDLFNSAFSPRDE